MKLSKNFMLGELKCRCGKCQPIVHDSFVQMLQRLRDDFESPLVINSWYRCPEHNMSVGGTKNSWHVKGKAVDIDWSEMRSFDKHKLLKLAMKHRFYGLGISEGFIHLDGRPPSQKGLWVY